MFYNLIGVLHTFQEIIRKIKRKEGGMRAKKQVFFAKGFSLVEVLMAIIILVLLVSTILIAYTNCFILIDTIKNINIATTAAQGMIEEMRTSIFGNIMDNYNGLNFVLNDIPESMGVVSVNNANPEFLEVTVSVCWKQRNRIIGEDTNLNGILDAGEDLNGNGIIDSVAQITTKMVNRK
ncbi:MAG: type II secretion system GspH family protein [Candidatus Omnitrophica bacterium]|jgi:type II secretory pathway pseudopilin PulG|nr:type II secretion system GspH family protein [Candidatus Omnitrophota bacterium]